LASEYGKTWSDAYDELYGRRDDPKEVVAFVDRHTAERSVLEFGVGTGRLAIPLAESGYRVHGVDASPEMLAILAGKPGAEGVTTTCGDMTNVEVAGSFGAVLIAFSTLFLLPDGGTQLRCLANAARHLAPGGVAVVETFVLDPNRWVDNRSLSVLEWTAQRLAVSVGTLDRAEQVIETAQVDVHGGQSVVRRNRLRYALPSELDLMARLSGLDLVHRAADFADTPFHRDSGNAVSVYRLG
jgi:SAM-dependent methyltransferase